MKKPQKTAAEAKAQRGRAFGFKEQGRVVKAQLFKRVAKVGVFCSVGGVYSAENHGVYLAVALERLACGVFG